MFSKNQTRKSTIVVIASYRYGHLAANCIESVLSQTMQPDHIIFVDDGAKDCEHLPRLYPQVEYLLRQKNLGVVNNFQDVLHKLPSNSKVMFVGADNWLRDDCIESVCSLKADVITYDIFVTGQQKSEILTRHKDRCKPFNGGYYWSLKGLHHGSMFYDVDIAKSVGGYKYDHQNKRSLEDKVLFQRMVNAGAKVEHIPESFLFYRRHTRNFNQC